MDALEVLELFLFIFVIKRNTILLLGFSNFSTKAISIFLSYPVFSITLCFGLWENMFNLPCPETLWIMIEHFFFSTFSRLLCINLFHCPCEGQSSSIYLQSLCRWNTVVFEILYWAFLSTTMFPKHIIAVQGCQTQCEQCCENAFSTQVSLNETT